MLTSSSPTRPAPLSSLLDAPIRRLTLADLPACLDLAADRGWAAEVQKWRLLLAVGHGYGLDAPDGGLAATVVLTRYGPALGAIGMVLVAARYNRRGLGRRLMTHVQQTAPGLPLTLYATAAGQPLYKQLGFRTLATNTTHYGCFQPASLPAGKAPVRVAAPADWDALLRLDAEATGTDRQLLLRPLLASAEQLWVLTQGPQPCGYAVAWRSADHVVIGPVIAPDLAGAQQLVAAVATAVGETVRLEIDARRPALLAWAAQHGLHPTFTTALMLHGAPALPGCREHVFAPITLALD